MTRPPFAPKFWNKVGGYNIPVLCAFRYHANFCSNVWTFLFQIMCLYDTNRQKNDVQIPEYFSGETITA